MPCQLAAVALCIGAGANIGVVGRPQYRRLAVQMQVGLGCVSSKQVDREAFRSLKFEAPRILAYTRKTISAASMLPPQPERSMAPPLLTTAQVRYAEVLPHAEPEQPASAARDSGAVGSASGHMPPNGLAPSRIAQCWSLQILSRPARCLQAGSSLLSLCGRIVRVTAPQV